MENVLNNSATKTSPSVSYGKRILREFLKSNTSRLGFVIILFTFAIALFAPFLANNIPLFLKYEGKSYFPVLREVFPFQYWVKYPELPPSDQLVHFLQDHPEVHPTYAPIPFSPSQYDLDLTLTAPSKLHWLGTDDQGRDVASRMIFGSRVSLSVGFVAVSIYVLIGIFLGACAGYFGGWIDIVISRLIEIMLCFPTFFLILAVLAFVGPSIYNIMIVIGLTGWTGIARLVRAEFLKQRKMDYVAASRIQGASWWRIVFRHVLPNSLAPVFVSATFGVASAILVESSLSFLGFGVQPPTPSWGEILSQSRDFMDIAWWLTLFPGLAIFLTITSYNLVGEGLRDAIDPRLKG